MKVWFIILHCVATLVLAQTPGTGDYQISGVVVDHLTNRPLNHVLVQIVRIGKDGGDASVLTSENGRFAFLHLPQGKYQINAQKRGQMPQPLHPDGGYATAIVVDGRQKTDSIVFDMRTDASISGTVIGEDGEPVRYAQASLFREVVNNGEAQTIQTMGGNTDSSGHFHFGHLEAGHYYIGVSAVPWFAMAAQVNLVYPVTFYGDTTDGKAAQTIVLAEGGTANVQINLRTAAGIRVKLPGQMRGVSLFTAGPGGSRIPVSTSIRGDGTHYYLRRGPARGTPPNSPAADAIETGGQEVDGQTDGQPLEIFNLAAGHYEVVTNGENGSPGQSFEPVDLVDGSTLDIGHAASSAISGRVIVEGTRENTGPEVFLGRGQFGMNAAVQPDGTFKFDKAPAGSYGIHLNRGGFAIASVSASGARVADDKLQLTGNSSVQLTIRAVPRQNLATIDGYATQNGIGTPGAMVLLLPRDSNSGRLIRRDQSDSDGSFTLPAVLPGQYTLLAIDNGRDLEYKNELVMKPYVAHGLAVTVPLRSNSPLLVAIQARQR